MSTPDPVYDRFKPGQRDPFAQWQYNIENNFNILSESFQKDHVGFYSSTQPSQTEQGKHNVVRLLVGPTPQTDLSENNVYTKLDVFNAAQLFMAMQNNTADFQFSAFQQSNFSAPAFPNSFFSSCLPGNFYFSCGMLPFTTNPTFVSLPPNIQQTAFMSATPFYSAVVGPNAFVLSLVNNSDDTQSIQVQWNGGLGSTAPAYYFLMYIGKMKEPTS